MWVNKELNNDNTKTIIIKKICSDIQHTPVTEIDNLKNRKLWQIPKNNKTNSSKYPKKYVHKNYTTINVQ